MEAWVPYEARIAEILLAASTPQSAEDILKTLQAQFGLTGVKISDINSVLYNGQGIYETAAARGSRAAAWRVRPELKAGAGKDPRAPAGPPEVADVVPGGPRAEEPEYGYGDLPPIDVAPPGEYEGLLAALGGSASEPEIVRRAVEALHAKGVRGLAILTDQPTGAAAWADDWSSWPAFDSPPIALPYCGGLRPRRLRAAEAHRAACAQSDLLCVVAADPPIAAAVAHLIDTFEAAGRPVHRFDPGEPPIAG